jgi:hypothetical protein
MTHGKELQLADAKKNIRNFVDDEIKKTGKQEKDIVVGHRMDLALIKKFMADIDAIGNAKIDSIRIYYAKSTRSIVADEYDVVVVPVLTDGNDYYPVYERPTAPGVAVKTMATAGSSTAGAVIGLSTPCPNVCGGS